MTDKITVGRIDLGPTEPRHLTQTEQRMMDGALRQSLKIIPDPAIDTLKRRIDARLNDYLVEMRPGYDDSITGFNEAWDIVRKAFAEALTNV